MNFLEKSFVFWAEFHSTMSGGQLAAVDVSGQWPGVGKPASHFHCDIRNYCSSKPVRIIIGHNERDGVSNHRRLDCLPNRLFRCRTKKAPKLRVTGLSRLCDGNSTVTGEFPRKGPVTRKMFPFDDIIVLGNKVNVVAQLLVPYNALVYTLKVKKITFSCCWILNKPELGQYQSCWCPGSLRRQVTRSLTIDWKINVIFKADSCHYMYTLYKLCCVPVMQAVTPNTGRWIHSHVFGVIAIIAPQHLLHTRSFSV